MESRERNPNWRCIGQLVRVSRVVDGQIVREVLPRTSLPALAFFDFLDFNVKQGEVLYAGGVSGSVAGLLQVNCACRRMR